MEEIVITYPPTKTTLRFVRNVLSSIQAFIPREKVETVCLKPKSRDAEMSEERVASVDVRTFDRIERKGFASKLAKMAITNPLPASLESSM